MTEFSVTPAGAFQDAVVKPLLDMYRQVVAQRYTPCPPSDLGRMLAAAPYYVSRKVDGELWFLMAESGEVVLVAANGRIATGQANVLRADLPDGTILAGELHVPNDGGRERVGDVRAAITNDPDSLAFAAFDVIRHDGRTWRDATYADRLQQLRSVAPTSGHVQAVPVTTVEATVDVQGLYSDLVESTGAEGIIVRCGDGRALKVKPEITLDAAVLGYTTRQGAYGPEVRSVLLGVSAADGSWVPLGTAGNMAEGVDRHELLSLLEPTEVDSAYRRAASTGQQYQMVTPSLVVECRVLDIQVEDSRGRSIRQPDLRLTGDRWSVAGQVPAATVLNAIVLRPRTDKGPPTEGATWRQIEPYVPAPVGPVRQALEPEIIRRQVWTKTAKDSTAVRKLVVWKTNQDVIDPLYPAYVVHWTDYSAGRKTPLSREVRPAPDAGAAEALADALVSENIKKGWEEHV